MPFPPVFPIGLFSVFHTEYENRRSLNFYEPKKKKGKIKLRGLKKKRCFKNNNSQQCNFIKNNSIPIVVLQRRIFNVSRPSASQIEFVVHSELFFCLLKLCKSFCSWKSRCLYSWNISAPRQQIIWKLCCRPRHAFSPEKQTTSKFPFHLELFFFFVFLFGKICHRFQL